MFILEHKGCSQNLSCLIHVQEPYVEDGIHVKVVRLHKVECCYASHSSHNDVSLAFDCNIRLIIMTLVITNQAHKATKIPFGSMD